jgi:hypothetical protein
MATERDLADISLSPPSDRGRTAARCTDVKITSKTLSNKEGARGDGLPRTKTLMACPHQPIMVKSIVLHLNDPVIYVAAAASAERPGGYRRRTERVVVAGPYAEKLPFVYAPTS